MEAHQILFPITARSKKITTGEDFAVRLQGDGLDVARNISVFAISGIHRAVWIKPTQRCIGIITHAAIDRPGVSVQNLPVGLYRQGITKADSLPSRVKAVVESAIL